MRILLLDTAETSVTIKSSKKKDKSEAGKEGLR
jgi:hypothetical protein